MTIRDKPTHSVSNCLIHLYVTNIRTSNQRALTLEGLLYYVEMEAAGKLMVEVEGGGTVDVHSRADMLVPYVTLLGRDQPI